MIFPCIDLQQGKVVQLIQGDQTAIELDSLKDVISKFSTLNTPIDLIDLDAAKGNGDNLDIIQDVCQLLSCRVGGGIRTVDYAEELINSGAEQVIIGTSAFKDGKVDYDFLTKLKNKIGSGQVIIAIDSKDGKIVVKGWQESTGIDAIEIVKQLIPYCAEIFYTYVDKEGMMQGTDFATIKKIKDQIGDFPLTAAGGISSIVEVEKLGKIGVNSVIGMAYYTGKMTLEEIKEHNEI